MRRKYGDVVLAWLIIMIWLAVGVGLGAAGISIKQNTLKYLIVNSIFVFWILSGVVSLILWCLAPIIEK